MSKTYAFTINRDVLIPSTKTIVAFVKSAHDLNKSGLHEYSALQVMKNAIEKNLWETKQNTDAKLMTTWAFYVKTLKQVGFTECSNINTKMRKLSIDEILSLDD